MFSLIRKSATLILRIRRFLLAKFPSIRIIPEGESILFPEI